VPTNVVLVVGVFVIRFQFNSLFLQPILNFGYGLVTVFSIFAPHRIFLLSDN